MTMTTRTRSAWLGAALLGSALSSACAPPAEITEATGVARTDVPIAGSVTLRDSSTQAKERKVRSRSDGTFGVDTLALVPPFLLRLEWTDAAGTNRLYAVADGDDNLDINPISDIAFGGAAEGANEEELFTGSDAARIKTLASKSVAVLAKLGSAVGPLFERYRIADPLADKAAVRRLLGDVTVKRTDGTVTIANKATRGVIFTGPIANLQSGTFDRSQMPGENPTPGSCTSFTYSDWGACQSNNTQTRTVQSSSPAGCTGGNPVTSQSCTYVPPGNACTSFTYSDWGACQSNNTQTRTVQSAIPAGCTGGNPVTSQSCTYVPPAVTCTSFTYSAWGACQSNNTQTRTVQSAIPVGCTGGNPVTSQACTYNPPLDGAALYESKCANCHFPLANSEKRGTTAARIQGKHGSRYGTAAEYEAIAKALL